ncbi:MAG: cytochrome c3 family protein [Pseudomonadota bacterium]
MKLLLVTLRKRPGSDQVSRREQLLDDDKIRVGRGVSMDIHLSDLNVDFHHATLLENDGRLILRSTAPDGLEINHVYRDEVDLSEGKKVSIGRYSFRAEAGRDGADFVVTLEETAAVQQTAHSQAKRQIEDVLPSRRVLSWVASLAVLVLFVAWPMAEVLQRDVPPDEPYVMDGMVRADVMPASPMEIAWTSGDISMAHSVLAHDCAACHQRPFERTTNNACLACHATVEEHLDLDQHARIGETVPRCASCHREHKGAEEPTQAACLTCHSNIRAISPDSKFADITDFAKDHPNFRLPLMTGTFVDEKALLPEVQQVRVEPIGAVHAPMTEVAGLKFPHEKHLVGGGKRKGSASLQCSNCHVVEAGGARMRPIEMERDCAHCHKLSFNAGGVERTLPHAQEDAVAQILQDYFLSAALMNTGVGGASEVDRQQVIDTALQQASAQTDAIFGTWMCGTCHEAQRVPDDSGQARWRVLPVLSGRPWLMAGRFEHVPHEAMDCTGCHAATGSSEASDVLMPGIAVCQDCHRGEAEAASARSACVSCHNLHVTGKEPMSPAHARIFHAMGAKKQRAVKRQADKK